MVRATKVFVTGASELPEEHVEALLLGENLDVLDGQFYYTGNFLST